MLGAGGRLPVPNGLENGGALFLLGARASARLNKRCLCDECAIAEVGVWRDGGLCGDSFLLLLFSIAGGSGLAFRRSCELELVNLSPRIRELLGMANLLSVFENYGRYGSRLP